MILRQAGSSVESEEFEVLTELTPGVLVRDRWLQSVKDRQHAGQCQLSVSPMVAANWRYCSGLT